MRVIKVEMRVKWGERSEIELVGGKMWWFGALKKECCGTLRRGRAAARAKNAFFFRYFPVVRTQGSAFFRRFELF